MQKYISKAKYLLKFPPHIIFKKVVFRIGEKVKAVFLKRRTLRHDFRGELNLRIPYNYFKIDDLDITGIDENIALYQANMFLTHRFNLLGSGWVSLDYDQEAIGLESFAYHMNLPIKEFDKGGDWLKEVVLVSHLSVSQNYWQKIMSINSEYVPIDWQKDFKSGFRWSAQKWYAEQYSMSEGKLGVDIKVPWELSRLQHLPQMAIYAKKLPEFKESLIIEFKCQVLDFFASNPISMGANFQCAMDVGIRAANLSLAYDLFRDLDKDRILDEDFEAILAENLFYHGRHILEDLEYREGYTSNHYLGNITGLAFISAYLNRTSEVDQWLAFSIQEIERNTQRQFYTDGGNFEVSTCYHRLSGEMVVYTSALLMALGEDKKNALRKYSPKGWNEKAPLFKPENQKFLPSYSNVFSQDHINKLFAIGQFTESIKKPNGEFPQFGDNDSGRFFRLSPNGELLKFEEAMNKYSNLKNYDKYYSDDYFWDENDLNMNTFSAIFGGLFDNSIFKDASEKFPLEKSLIRSALSNVLIQEDVKLKPPIEKSLDDRNLTKFEFEKVKTIKLLDSKEDSLLKNLSLTILPDFQVYIFNSDLLYLAVAGICSEDQHPTGSHVHNDALSIELSYKSEDIIVDPGTYLYTPLPDQRNKFRATAAHNTLVVENEEQNPSLSGRIGLFSVDHDAKIQLLHHSNSELVLELNYRHVRQVRSIKVERSAVVVHDYSNVPFRQNFNYKTLYSNGYGKLLNQI